MGDMKSILKTLLILTTLLSLSAYAQTYALFQGGYGQYNQKDAASHKVYPSGTSYGAGLGVRKNFFEVEAVFEKFTGKAEVDHDDKSNSIIHKQSSFLLALNFYLNKSLYARLGYGFYRVDQNLDKVVSAASEEGAKKAYGIKEDAISDGVLYRGGFVIYDGKKINIYTQFENQVITSLKANSWNASLGFKFYFD